MFKSIDIRKHLLGILVVLGCLVWFSNANNLFHHYDIKEVDVFGANELIKGGALIIDVRGPEQYNYRHIPGAILVTLDELRAGMPAKLAAVAKTMPILVYCGDGLTHGPEGTELLNQKGFTGAVNLKPGIEGWVASGNLTVR